MYENTETNVARIVVRNQQYWVEREGDPMDHLVQNPRYIARVADKAKGRGFKVSMLEDFTVEIESPSGKLIYYPSDDTQPVYNFKRGDQVLAVGVDGTQKVDAVIDEEVYLASGRHVARSLVHHVA